METLNKIFNWFEGKVGKLKSILLFGMTVLFIFSVVVNGCDRRKTKKLDLKVSSLHTENQILNKQIQEKSREIEAMDELIISLNDTIKLKDNILKALRVDYNSLQADKASLPNNVASIPVDSSYAFLNDVAYPYQGEKMFPFNEPQVKSIHLSYLESISLEKLNYNLMGQVGTLEDKIDTKDNILNIQQDQIGLLKENSDDHVKIIKNKDEEIELKDKEIKKEHRIGVFYKITTLLASLAFLISLVF